MPKVLLLFDTTEKDLARDVKDLISELDVEVVLIPRSPDLGKTLDAKEEYYFREADGAIFLITPGATRGEQLFPSPSVASEMGQAKQRFKDRPGSVIYLVDSACRPPAVDQSA